MPRRLLQAGFLVVTVVGVFVVQGNAERWCPMGGVEALYGYVTEGNVLCSLGTSNFFVLGGLLASVLLLRRAFCSHACPIGTVSEWLRGLGARLRLPLVRVPPRLDALLSPLKYAVLALVLFVTWRAGELLFRSADPCYAILSRHGEDITAWAYVVLGAIVVGSLFLTLPFCRWLCPLAAVMNPLSFFGLARIGRVESGCADCGRCARACPMAIPVDRVPVVTHARCTACLECLGACPLHRKGRNPLSLRFAGLPRALPRASLAAVLVLVLSASVAAALLVPLPSFTWGRGEVPAGAASVELAVGDLTCRGRANLLVYFLDRDDDLELAGALRLEAWPGPGAGRARVTFEPGRTDADAVRAAITEPYYDAGTDTWRLSPFAIAGYDPLAAPP